MTPDARATDATSDRERERDVLPEDSGSTGSTSKDSTSKDGTSKDSTSKDSKGSTRKEADRARRSTSDSFDLARLFQVSRQIDRLRDDCRWLLRHSPDLEPAVLDQAIARYRRLTRALRGMLSDESIRLLRSDLTGASPTSLAELLFAAGQLAAWTDGLLLGPTFVSSQSGNISQFIGRTAPFSAASDEPGPPGAYL